MTLRVSERSFQAAVEDLARLTGWLTYHTHSSQFSAAGFPDLVMIRSNRLVVAELKTRTGRLSKPQMAWLDAFRAAGVDTYLWREPESWPTIKRVLR